MNNNDRSLVLEFKRRLPLEVKSHLKRIIVFGSRVRGEATEDSDLDIIALVDEKTQEIEKGFDDIAYQIMWEHDFKPMISLKIHSESQFDIALKKGFSFYRQVQKEGISL